jgi:CheY-like chemotaxis protein
MTDDLTPLRLRRRPTAAQPLLGLTLLVVEDSRFASEAVRLLAMRSGARLRRADCLASARRHLAVFRPAAVLVDLGLPDGCGTDLIAELRAGDVAPPAILAVTGDPAAADRARQAGAAGVIVKPLPGLAAFQSILLAHLPEAVRPAGPRVAEAGAPRPDSIALQDDLAHAAEVLDGPGDTGAMGYVAQFLASVARTAEDSGLAEAAGALASSLAAGTSPEAARGRLRQLLQARLSERGAI